MERLTEWTGEEWIPRQEKLNGKYIGHKACMKKLAEYEATDLTPDEVETLKYLRNRYEDETYDYCGEYGTEDCQFKAVIDKHLAGNTIWIPVSERLPEDYIKVWMTIKYDAGVYRTIAGRWKGKFLWNNGRRVHLDVVAWQPYSRPEPYRPE